ncbi:MAG: thiamine diphosphokinase [Clostridia bacterium]|nr:thiamine diphosphokinase [Clostridia bacterium]MBR3865109.1 thiamine diphosphokinase [Clostridia bacterium]
MKRCVIVGGADINNYEYIKDSLGDEDYIIFCDSGLKHMEGLGVGPSLIVGDFDSFEDPRLDVETIVLPCEKDDTDTVYGVREGIKRGFDDFLIIGAVGARLDHTLGNLYILSMLQSFGKRGRIIDDYSEMELVTASPAMVDDSFSFFSLVNITGKAKGVTIKNAKYPLENAEITCSYQYGISNEVLVGKTAEVSVKDGALLLIKVF